MAPKHGRSGPLILDGVQSEMFIKTSNRPLNYLQEQKTSSRFGKLLKSRTDQVPVRDFRTIAETIVANSAVNQEAGQLIELVRVALSRAIIQEVFGTSSNLSVVTLAPAMEQMLMSSATSNNVADVTLEPGLAEQLQRSINDAAQSQIMKGSPAVLLVPAILRPILAKFVRFSAHALHVLSYNEIPDDKQVTIEATAG